MHELQENDDDSDIVLDSVETDQNVKDWKVSKGAKIRNRYNQVPHLTPDPGYQWESDKLTV